MAKIIDPYGWFATEEKQDQRKEICASCDKVVKHFGLYVCTECSCHINTKVKLEGVTCPLDKW